jgi:hypothetical protein
LISISAIVHDEPLVPLESNNLNALIFGISVADA